MKKFIPPIYLIFSFAPIAVLLLFATGVRLDFLEFLISVFSPEIVFFVLLLTSPVLAVLGVVIVHIFPDSRDRTMIRIGMVTNVLAFAMWLSIVSVVGETVFKFRQDSLNLAQIEPFLAKPFDIIKT